MVLCSDGSSIKKYGGIGIFIETQFINHHYHIKRSTISTNSLPIGYCNDINIIELIGVFENLKNVNNIPHI